MCGITGFWDFKHRKNREENSQIILEMTHALSKRGPDAYGTWHSSSGLFLGHRRLSIIDLSEHGAQPMVSGSGKYVITYNGEVFNAPEIREELCLLGVSFRGHSDTEVVLEACAMWGVEKACGKFNGMFAFALFSREEQKLFLVRDRIGIKPLYWGFENNLLFFGSELKSLRPHPLWSPSLCLEALGLYFKYNYIRAPFTIFKNFYKVTPGCYVTIDAEGQTMEHPFWQLSNFFKPQRDHASFSQEDHIEFLKNLLKDAVKKRLYSDVPLGTFLSGGVDSTLITALMQEVSFKPIQTFSIGFEEPSYDEAPAARAIARHLKTEHHELYVTAKDSMDIIPHLSHMYDEPFADASQIPTFLVSKLARQHVTVSLSGDGGDELFLGYDRYQIGQKLYGIERLLPKPLKMMLSASLGQIPPSTWNSLLKWAPKKYQFSHLSEKAYKLGDVLGAETPLDFFESLVSVWNKPQQILHPSLDVLPHLYPSEVLSFLKDPFALQSYGDIKTYLPECVLTKVDRASMALGLEVRVPLLDYRVVEYASTLPSSFKIFKGIAKYPLRKILSSYVPCALMDRPKKGFSVPIGEWLRGPLKEWAEDLLCEHALQEGGILNSVPIRQAWQTHVSGKANLEYGLWGVLMFQQWRKTIHV